MSSNDVAAVTPSDETNAQRPDRSLAEQLVDEAKADGRSLVGPGGLLADLTKQVLETSLEVEMEDHVGYAKHAAEGRNLGNSRNGTRSKTVRIFLSILLRPSANFLASPPAPFLITSRSNSR